MTGTRKSLKRVFVDAPLDGQPSLALDQDQAHYLGRVLRCRVGDEIVVFDARGSERLATIDSLSRRRPTVTLGSSLEPLPEPQMQVYLLQALVKSDAMDLIVQKATELGARAILATRTEFSVVQLKPDRRPKRLAHWRRIATGACEQSGRHCPPELEICDSLAGAVAVLPQDCARVALQPGGPGALRSIEADSICFAIGPEGGFSAAEQAYLQSEDFTPCSLGPRTLRAETAAIAALSGAQILTGDLR